MSWERRPNAKGRYYTRDRCINGRRVRIYLGCGPLAHAAAAEDLRRQIAHRQAAVLRKAEDARWRSASSEVDRLSALIALVTKATMLCAGFHCNHGDWNR